VSPLPGSAGQQEILVRFSIVIPAHNEERFLSGCLDSIERASSRHVNQVETIVVLNRCSDGTERIARQRRAVVVRDNSKNLACIRNAGARQATGEVLVTIDADSRMSENMLCEIDAALRSGKYIGGGVCIRPERTSWGIGSTFFLLKISMLVTGLSGGLFWCLRRDFEEIHGFNENLFYAEDYDFGKRLKAHGRKRNLKYRTLRRAFIQTSCRKFDRFGEWHAFSLLLFNAWKLGRGFRDADSSFANRYFYDFNSAKPGAAADAKKPRR
jgi:glycosyltransferase involved in cell wall biosynthesis